MSTKKHTIYVINTVDSGKSYWNRAGVAFENKDGSFTFKLDILPLLQTQSRSRHLLHPPLKVRLTYKTQWALH